MVSPKSRRTRCSTPCRVEQIKASVEDRVSLQILDLQVYRWRSTKITNISKVPIQILTSRRWVRAILNHWQGTFRSLFRNASHLRREKSWSKSWSPSPSAARSEASSSVAIGMPWLSPASCGRALRPTKRSIKWSETGTRELSRGCSK